VCPSRLKRVNERKVYSKPGNVTSQMYLISTKPFSSFFKYYLPGEVKCVFEHVKLHHKEYGNRTRCVSLGVLFLINSK